MLIIADDYTGAADAAVGLAMHGFSAMILLDPCGLGAGSDVTALDLDTRHRTAADALEMVRSALARNFAEDFVFKKIDSTLRGQIGAELRALADATKDCTVPMLVAPAVPENGRIVVGGRVLVRGVPLEQTDIWQCERATSDPDMPARTSQLLARSGLRAEEIHLSALREGVPSLRARLIEHKAAGVDAVILDSETAKDLAIIAETAASFERMPVCVGAAGLAGSFGRLMGRRDAKRSFARTTTATPVLLAIASQSGTARAQIEFLASRSDVAMIETTGAVEPLAKRAAETLADGRHVLLHAPVACQDALSRGNAATMAVIVAQVAGRAGALVASGGDTARACLQSMGYTRMNIEGELAPGVVLGHPVDRTGFAFVSKAGDFGDDKTLSTCIDLLTAPAKGTAL